MSHDHATEHDGSRIRGHAVADSRPTMSGHREAIAEVLAAHEPFGGGWFCTCIPEGEDGVREFLEPSWEAHLADALLGSDVLEQIRAEARAEAWDEGFTACADMVQDGAIEETRNLYDTNPHRAALKSEGVA